MTAIARAERWLFGGESPARLRFAQLGLSGLVGLRIVLGPYRQLAGQPSALFDPPWFLSALHSMPSVRVLIGLQVIGSVAAVVAVAGRRRSAFVLAWVCLVILAGLRASRGKILHNDLLLIWACVPFLFAPFDGRLDDREPSPRYGWPIRAAMVIVSVAYFRAGLAKVLTSGAAWVVSDNMRWILYEATVREPPRAPTDAVALFVVHRPWLAVLTAAILLSFELGFPAVLFWPRTRPTFVIAAVVLHAGTYLTIGLDYWSWAAVVALVLVDWPALGATARHRALGLSAASRSGAPRAGH